MFILETVSAKWVRMASLFTIGYEKAPLEDVIAALKGARVKILFDTRAVAASRRAGFSKKMLSASLEAAGIHYLHFQKLGTPAEGREAAHGGDYKKFWKIYEKQIRTKDAQAELAELQTLVKNGKRVCLLCYERNPDECHRKRIAELVHENTGAKIENLFPSPLGI
jgi:uncharacterized protein (DUF488 family)